MNQYSQCPTITLPSSFLLLLRLPQWPRLIPQHSMDHRASHSHHEIATTSEVGGAEAGETSEARLEAAMDEVKGSVPTKQATPT